MREFVQRKVFNVELWGGSSKSHLRSFIGKTDELLSPGEARFELGLERLGVAAKSSAMIHRVVTQELT